MPTMRIRQVLRSVFTWFVALLILFEEWGWEPLARLASRLAKLPLFGWLERRIATLPPYAALAVFALPALALLPVKLLALWAITQGHRVFGLVVIVGAKLVGTAVVARLYQLTQASLMQLGWFARLHARWIAWKDRVVAEVRRSPAWQALTTARLRMRLRSKRLWRRWFGNRATKTANDPSK